MIGYKRQVNLTYEKAVAKVREELAKEGFGVLTEVDIKAASLSDRRSPAASASNLPLSAGNQSVVLSRPGRRRKPAASR